MGDEMETGNLASRTRFWRAVGVMAIWSGNENSLFIGNVAIDYDGHERLTRGEQWTAPQDLTRGTYSDQPGYVAFSTPSLSDTFVREGDVAWLAGAGFSEDYGNYLDAGGDDVLGFRLWHRFPDGCAMQIGPSTTFYEHGGKLARAAGTYYESRLVRGANYDQRDIQAARRLYEGSPGVSTIERRLADAFWYYVSENYEMFSRTEAQAERFDGISPHELITRVKKRAEFYAEPRLADGSMAAVRALAEENRRLRAMITYRPTVALDTTRHEIEVLKHYVLYSNRALHGDRFIEDSVGSRSTLIRRLLSNVAHGVVISDNELEAGGDERNVDLPYHDVD